MLALRDAQVLKRLIYMLCGLCGIMHLKKIGVVIAFIVVEQNDSDYSITSNGMHNVHYVPAY